MIPASMWINILLSSPQSKSSIPPSKPGKGAQVFHILFNELLCLGYLKKAQLLQHHVLTTAVDLGCP